MLAQSHRKMNDELYLPYTQELKSLQNSLKNSFSENRSLKEEELEILKFHSKKMQTYLKRINSILSMMLSKTDNLLGEMKLINDSPEYYNKIKERMLGYATKSIDNYNRILDILDHWKTTENLSTEELSQQMADLEHYNNEANESNMHGHYKVH